LELQSLLDLHSELAYHCFVALPLVFLPILSLEEWKGFPVPSPGGTTGSMEKTLALTDSLLILSPMFDTD